MAHTSEPAAVSYPFFWDKSAVLVCAVLIGLIAVVFGQTLTFSSVSLDESLYGAGNPLVAAGFSGKGLKFAFTEMPNYWQPGAFLAHMLDFQLFGARLWGHHLTSVLIHCVNTILVFLLFRSLTGATWPSAWVAAVFAIHPMHVEPVAWITARRDLMSTLFAVLAILAYLRYLEAPSIRRYSWIAVCMFAAAATKPVMVVIPVLLLALDIWPIRRPQSFITGCLEKLPLFGISALFTILSLMAFQNTVQTGENPIDVGKALPGSEASAFYGFYLAKFAWPASLSFDYSIYDDPNHRVYQALAIAVLVIGVITLLRFHSRFPSIAAGLLWFGAGLAPTLGMAVADRFTYLPYVGLCMTFAWSFQRLQPAYQKAAATAGLLLIGAMAWLSYDYAASFQGSVPLYTHAIEATSGRSNNARMWLGSYYLSEGKIPQAAEQFAAIVKQYPQHFAAGIQLAHSLLMLGDVNQGVDRLNEAVQLRAGDPSAQVLAGHFLQEAGLLSAAVGHYRTALQLDPSNENAKAALQSLSFLNGEGR